MNYLDLISLGLTILNQLLGIFIKNKAPQAVIDAVQAAIKAIQAHRADLMTKIDWENQRG